MATLPSNPRPLPVGYSGLREIPLRDLVVELDRIEHQLARRATATHRGTDLASEALRGRERAVVAEIRRRPGGTRLRAHRPATAPGEPPG